MTFSHLKAFSKLLEKAKNPIDLTKKLTAERIEKMRLKRDGFCYFFGTERITDEVLKDLYALAKESDALEKMNAMQEGEMINISEKRSVLHTAMRDHFDQKLTKKEASHASGLSKIELDKLELFLKKHEGKFTDLIQIGIGGSDLGPKALAIALEAYRIPNRNVHFISNVDPDDATQVLSKVDLKKTLVVVVSKSGTTLETLTNEKFVWEKMENLGLDPKNHFVAVTGKSSPMDDPDRYLASFYIWDFVGGRYSATSMVGAVSLSFFVGIAKFKELLKGAHMMDVHARSVPVEENIPLMAALIGIWNRNFLKVPTLAIIPYSQALHRFPAHLQQLDMESNGKRVDKDLENVDFTTGPVVWGEPGTNGQHSFYQLIHQGTDPIALEFIGFKKSQYGVDLKIEGTTSQEKLLANLFAQSIALAQGKSSENLNKVFPGNRPNSILFLEKLDPHSIGALLSFYEHKVAFQGFIWNINSFDQEGVQLGKVLATKILDLMASKGDFDLGKAYLNSI